MTVQHVGTGATVKGTTSLSPPFPNATGIGDDALIFVSNKQDTATPDTPSGWTLVYTGSGGSGSAGNDSGPARITVFRKTMTTVADSSITVALTISGAATSEAFIKTQRSSVGHPLVTAVTSGGSDTSAGTSWSVTGGTSLSPAVGDLLIAASAVNTANRIFSTEALAISGATFGTVTERHDDQSSQASVGVALVVSDHPVTGAGSGAPTFTMTGSGSAGDEPTGHTVIVQLIEDTGIAHDTVYTEAVMTGTDDPFTFSHTPGSTLKGVWVSAVHGGSVIAEHVVNVTYGGVPMLRVADAIDPTTEPGRAYLYFLGKSIPSGTQTVSVDTDATTDDIHFVCGGFTATTDIELVDRKLAQENQSNPSVTLAAHSRSCLAIAALYSGNSAVTDAAPTASVTAVHDHDFGVFISRVDKQNVASADDFVFGYTSASDDVGLAAATFGEVVAPAGIAHAGTVTRAIRTDTSDPFNFTHTPGEVIQGVWVAAYQMGFGDATDHISGITYGGQTMTRVRTDADTGSELGRTYLYFLGTGIPTGAQTVAVDTDGTATDIEFVCGGFLGSTDIVLMDSDGVSENAANPSVTLSTTGRRSVAIGVLYSGLGTGIAAPTDVSTMYYAEQSSGNVFVGRQSVPSTSDFTFGFTIISDDVAFSAANFAEYSPDALVTAPATVAAVAAVGAPAVAASTFGIDPYSTSSLRTATTDPWTFSHTPLGTLRGVIVMVAHGTDSTDHVSSMTYGGQAMSRVQTNVDTVGEPGRTDIWFLGSGIPSGTQTISADLTTSTTTDIGFQVVGLNGNKNIVLVDSDGVSEDATNPSVTLTSNGQICASVGAFYSGTADITNMTAAGTAVTLLASNDLGVSIWRFDRQTTPGTGDFTYAFTLGADDVALSAAMFCEDTTITPDAVAAVAAVGSPTISVGTDAVVSAVPAVAAVGAPTIVAGDDINIVPTAVAAVTAVGAPTLTTSSTVTPSVVAAVAAVGSPILKVFPATVPAVAAVGSPVRQLVVTSSGELGGITGEMTITEDREGWQALITQPLDGAIVTVGSITVIAELLSATGDAGNVHVQISEFDNFVGPEPGGQDRPLDEAISNLVGDGELATLSLTGLEAETTYYLRARGGVEANGEWGDWSTTVTVTTSVSVGEAYAWLYASDVDESVPIPHLWEAHLIGDDQAQLTGAGFGDPQGEFNGEIKGNYNDTIVTLTVNSWDRVSATGDATTTDRAIVFGGDVDPEHDVVNVDIPADVNASGIGVYVETEDT